MSTDNRTIGGGRGKGYFLNQLSQIATNFSLTSEETESIQQKEAANFITNSLFDSSSYTQNLISSTSTISNSSFLITERLFGNQTDQNDETTFHHDTTSAAVTSGGSHLLLLFALLVLINLIVILGNILVILAVYATAKLRNVTNIFIVSLATADLLLGVFVLPYALMFEILDVWIFGQIWCRGWLVTDVWISTASILNLCAISVDRYVAVTRPVKYRSIMTPRRAKTIVAGVWIVSFLICFPPLLQHWNPSSGSSSSSSSAIVSFRPPAPEDGVERAPISSVLPALETVDRALLVAQEKSFTKLEKFEQNKRRRRRRRRAAFSGVDRKRPPTGSRPIRSGPRLSLGEFSTTSTTELLDDDGQLPVESRVQQKPKTTASLAAQMDKQMDSSWLSSMNDDDDDTQIKLNNNNNMQKPSKSIGYETGAKGHRNKHSVEIISYCCRSTSGPLAKTPMKVSSDPPDHLAASSAADKVADKATSGPDLVDSTNGQQLEEKRPPPWPTWSKRLMQQQQQPSAEFAEQLMEPLSAGSGRVKETKDPEFGAKNVQLSNKSWRNNENNNVSSLSKSHTVTLASLVPQQTIIIIIIIKRPLASQSSSKQRKDNKEERDDNETTTTNSSRAEFGAIIVIDNKLCCCCCWKEKSGKLVDRRKMGCISIYSVQHKTLSLLLMEEELPSKAANSSKSSKSKLPAEFKVVAGDRKWGPRLRLGKKWSRIVSLKMDPLSSLLLRATGTKELTCAIVDSQQQQQQFTIFLRQQRFSNTLEKCFIVLMQFDDRQKQMKNTRRRRRRRLNEKARKQFSGIKLTEEEAEEGAIKRVKVEGNGFSKRRKDRMLETLLMKSSSWPKFSPFKVEPLNLKPSESGKKSLSSLWPDIFNPNLSFSPFSASGLVVPLINGTKWDKIKYVAAKRSLESDKSSGLEVGELENRVLGPIELLTGVQQTKFYCHNNSDAVFLDNEALVFVAGNFTISQEEEDNNNNKPEIILSTKAACSIVVLELKTTTTTTKTTRKTKKRATDNNLDAADEATIKVVLEMPQASSVRSNGFSAAENNKISAKGLDVVEGSMENGDKVCDEKQTGSGETITAANLKLNLSCRTISSNNSSSEPIVMIAVDCEQSSNKNLSGSFANQAIASKPEVGLPNSNKELLSELGEETDDRDIDYGQQKVWLSSQACKLCYKLLSASGLAELNGPIAAYGSGGLWKLLLSEGYCRWHCSRLSRNSRDTNLESEAFRSKSMDRKTGGDFAKDKRRTRAKRLTVPSRANGQQKPDGSNFELAPKASDNEQQEALMWSDRGFVSSGDGDGFGDGDNQIYTKAQLEIAPKTNLSQPEVAPPTLAATKQLTLPKNGSSSSSVAVGGGGGAELTLARRRKSGCALFDDKPYVIYSALGSFYIPMLVMIFFYSRIYLVASRAQKALQRGYMTTKWPPTGNSGRGRSATNSNSGNNNNGHSGGAGGNCAAGGGSGGGGAGPGGGAGGRGGAGCGSGSGKGGKCGGNYSGSGGVERVTLRIHRREKGPIVLHEFTAPSSSQQTANQTQTLDSFAAASVHVGVNSAEIVGSGLQFGAKACGKKGKSTVNQVAGSFNGPSSLNDHHHHHTSSSGSSKNNDNYNNKSSLLKLSALEQQQALKSKNAKSNQTKNSCSNVADSGTELNWSQLNGSLITTSGGSFKRSEVDQAAGTGAAIVCVESPKVSGADVIQGLSTLIGSLASETSQTTASAADSNATTAAVANEPPLTSHSGTSNSDSNSIATSPANRQQPKATDTTTKSGSLSCELASDDDGKLRQHHHHRRAHHHLDHHLDHQHQSRHHHHHNHHSGSGSGRHKHKHHHHHHHHYNDSHSHHHNHHHHHHHHQQQQQHNIRHHRQHNKQHDKANLQQEHSNCSSLTMQQQQQQQQHNTRAETRKLIKCTSIAEEPQQQSGGSSGSVAPPGELRQSQEESCTADDRSSISSVQITISQYEGEERDDILLGSGGKCERSHSLDIRSTPDQQSAHDHLAGQVEGEGSNELLTCDQLARVDRSQSCGPTPTILLNWNPETGSAEAQLSGAKRATATSEQLLAIGGESPRSHSLGTGQHQQQQQTSAAGSQASGLSIMASLPMAANQVRKQSMMLLSSFTTRSSQTLRRLSMVASHPMDSLLNRSRSNDSDTSDTANSATGDKDDDDDEVSRRRKKKKRSKRRKKRKRHANSRAPKKTFDDYLMAVAGIDGSSSEEDGGGTNEDDDEDDDDDDDDDDDEEEDEDEEEEDNNILKAVENPRKYSLLLGSRGEKILVPSIQIVASQEPQEKQQLQKLEKVTSQKAGEEVILKQQEFADQQSAKTSVEGADANSRSSCDELDRRSLVEQDVSLSESQHLTELDNDKRPPSALHRQGGYYERATSRAGAQEQSLVTQVDLGGKAHSVVSVLKSTISGLKPQSTGSFGRDGGGSLSILSRTNDKATLGSVLVKEGGLNNNNNNNNNNSKLKGGAVGGSGVSPGGGQRRRGAKRTSRWHAKRLHAETKAAKTVAIIIGGFIFCWLPFFTAYLSRAIICERPDCVPQSLLSLFIWLGYLNSAINPVIYGLFSADFRHAFKNILCRCRFRSNADDTVVVSVLVDSIIKSIL